jgi:predicted negative regulator of RcsB-dependent stress response
LAKRQAEQKLEQKREKMDPILKEVAGLQLAQTFFDTGDWDGLQRILQTLKAPTFQKELLV